MSRREEFVGVRTIEAANVYGEGQHLYNMWLRTEEPIVRCRDCKKRDIDLPAYEVCPMDGYDPDGFCKWGERK